MDSSLLFIGFVVGIALIFDFMNGFHDAANSIATIVSTRVLRPFPAVAWAAFFNFIAFLFFGLHVATTLGKGIIDPAVVTPTLIASALLGAIIWNIITWYYGIPSSSSHALIGGLCGTAMLKGGLSSLSFQGLAKIGASIVLSPVLGFIFAYIMMVVIIRIFFHSPATRVNQWFRRLQLVSASLYSLGHGGNDAQKTMGIIAILLYSSGQLHGEFSIPLWVVLACQGAMGLGTLLGGWRIVKTMGMRITELKPVGGFCAETGGAVTLFLATSIGIPVSTTHTITGSIMGAGAVTRLSSVRWGIARRIVWAWVLTIPASAIISALCAWGLQRCAVFF